MTPPQPTPRGEPHGRPALMLALATAGFAINFWAWALLSPLAPRFKDLLAPVAARSRPCSSPYRSSWGPSAGSRWAR